jgi:hypothetical protein
LLNPVTFFIVLSQPCEEGKRSRIYVLDVSIWPLSTGLFYLILVCFFVFFFLNFSLNILVFEWKKTILISNMKFKYKIFLMWTNICYHGEMFLIWNSFNCGIKISLMIIYLNCINFIAIILCIDWSITKTIFCSKQYFIMNTLTTSE